MKCKPNVYPIIQSDLLGNFTDRDVNYDRIEGMKAYKYLKESCYHHIECSITNSLVALMRKWYLNSVFQPYSYPQRFQESVNGTSINTNHLACTWRVEMKGEDSIREEGGNERKWLKSGEKHCSNQEQICNQTCEKYIRTDLFGLCRWRFSLVQIKLSSWSCHWSPLYLLSCSF